MPVLSNAGGDERMVLTDASIFTKHYTNILLYYILYNTYVPEETFEELCHTNHYN